MLSFARGMVDYTICVFITNDLVSFLRHVRNPDETRPPIPFSFDISIDPSLDCFPSLPNNRLPPLISLLLNRRAIIPFRIRKNLILRELFWRKMGG
jgi:hypothetical protein